MSWAAWNRAGYWGDGWGRVGVRGGNKAGRVLSLLGRTNQSTHTPQNYSQCGMCHQGKAVGIMRNLSIIAFEIGIHLSGNTYVLLIRVMTSKPQGSLLN